MTGSAQGRVKTPELPGTGGVWFSVVLLAVAVLLFIVRGAGPDRDKNGMSNAYESLLGLDGTTKAGIAAGEDR
ncbi:MAG: hypothetical protein ISS31_03430 [Kiritimatiellae bacterium]|nr:hypothetical protein [Kiritimatiellia bacterium]